MSIFGATAWVVAAALIRVYHFDGEYKTAPSEQPLSEGVNEVEKSA
jgi:hypothetical protein